MKRSLDWPLDASRVVEGGDPATDLVVQRGTDEAQLAHGPIGDQGVEDFLNSTPRFSVTSNWHETKKSIVRNGFQAEGAEAKVRLYDYYLHKMESALEKREWLASDRFTFADIAIMPYVNRLDMLSLDQMWKNGRLPGVENWFSRIKARDSFKPMLLDWCPEDLTNDLRDYGKTSWPEVRKILGIP